jgi:hypothetical protein
MMDDWLSYKDDNSKEERVRPEYWIYFRSLDSDGYITWCIIIEKKGSIFSI